MGLIHTFLLHGAGARVVVVDHQASLAPLARSAGADMFLPLLGSPDEARAAILELSAGRGADAVFCVRGGAPAVELALAASARGGALVLFQSIPQIDRVIFSANDVHYRELQITGSVCQTRSDFQRAADLVSARSDSFAFVTRERFEAERAQEGFARALGTDVHRVMISFP
jgi:L-iditol 2-dehydrogenase